jgi:molecular chaperone HscC
MSAELNSGLYNSFDMDMIVGIDLGTTNSAVAHLGADGPVIIPNALGERLTPSVVGVDDRGVVLVGQMARDYAVTRPDRCASVFKRLMGTDRTTTLGSRAMSPEMLSSVILRSLKNDAEAYFGHEVTRAVVTVPAYFNDQQRKATMAAGRIAGLTVERILNEPTAAAIAYGFQGGEDKTVLVFDLGGGTFDVSIVEQFEGTLEVRSSAGETALGGEDFTRTMVARVLERAGMPFERTEATMPLVVSRMVQQCEKAKQRLSRDTTATVRIPNAAGDLENGREITITRDDLEQWVQPILSRLDAPIRRALSDAKLSREKIDDVILVGGATRMPVVVARVHELFGKMPHSKLNPDEVVALGAAVQAGLVGENQAVNDLVVTDVAPFSLGVMVSKQFGTETRDGYFDPIIDRNTVIPVSRIKRYSTMAPNQTMITLKIYQGESRRAEDNFFLGEFDVKGIPAGPAGQDVDVRFTYDLNGVLEVEATIVRTKKVVTHVITRNAKGLSEANIRKALREMENLKLHPRDDAVNHALLARAERVFKELNAEQRVTLTILLDGYESGLESRDPEVIVRHREQLEAFLDHLEGHSDNDDPGETADV